MKRLPFLAAAVLALAGSIQAKVMNATLATVNGEPVLLSELDKNWSAFVDQQKRMLPPDQMTDGWAKEGRKKLFEQMIDDKILQQEAKKRKIRVNQQDLENGIAQVKARFLPADGQDQLRHLLEKMTGGKAPEEGASIDIGAAWKDLAGRNPDAVKKAEDKFRAELAKEGMDAKKFQDRIRDQLAVMQLSQEEVRRRRQTPTPEEVKGLFAKVQSVLDGKLKPGADEESQDLASIAQFYKQKTGEQVRARHILIAAGMKDGRPQPWSEASLQDKSAARKKIDDLRKRLLAGEDFADLASKNSDDKGSAARGGDLGFFQHGQMVPSFDKTAFSLPVGKVSAVVESEFGLHLIKVEEKRAASKFRFEDAEDDLGEYLARAKAQKAFESFVAELRGQAAVKYTPEAGDLAK